MRLAVSGSRGFIGSHLTRASRERRIQVLPLVGDVCRPLLCPEADALIHLAARTPPKWGATSQDGLLTNVLGSLHLLISGLGKVSRFILTSSSAIYGARTGKASEDIDPSPVSEYGLSKLIAEHACMALGKRMGLQVTVLRLFNVYGPGQEPPYVVPALIDACWSGRPASMPDPYAVRDFVFISDVIEALLASVQFEGQSATFNIGSSIPTRLFDLIACIGQLMHAPVAIDSNPSESEAHESVGNIWADISRATESLQWRPRVELREGLSRTIAADTRVGGSR